MGDLFTLQKTDHEHVGGQMKINPAVLVARYGLDDRASDATITVAAEDTNVRQILIQLKKADGSAVDAVTPFVVAMFLNAAMTAFVVTGGSTGIELGTGAQGSVLAIVAKKIFLCTCENNGQCDLKWTDTQTETFSVGVWLPNGKWVTSTAVANT